MKMTRYAKAPLAAALAVVATAIPAHADDGPAGDGPRDNFLFVLHSEGINTPSVSDAIKGGYELCDQIASGVMPRTLVDEIAAHDNGLSADQADTVVATAVTWLCPQYLRQYLASR